MPQIRQFIHFIPLRDSAQPCLVVISRQHSKAIAEKQAFLDLQSTGSEVQFEKMCTKELVVDEEGVIRVIDDNNKVLSSGTTDV